MQRILLVDDDDCFRKMLRHALSLMGYDVVEARNGVEAVKLDEHLPSDLILTDILMPEKDGLETIRALRHKHPGRRIVAMSGGGWVSPAAYLKIAQAMGADSVLTKPFSCSEIKLILPDTRGAV